jgi:hypothetical protein
VTGGIARRVAAGFALSVSVIGVVWAAGVLLFGGFDLSRSGLVITSHDPMRPLLVAILAFGAFFYFVGPAVAVRWLRNLSGTAQRTWNPARRHLSRLALAGHLDRAAVAVLVAAAVVVGIASGSKAAAGSDAYGYISEAELFLHGQVAVPQPWVEDVPWEHSRWTFSPLGYTPSRGKARFTLAGFDPTVDSWAIVPTYSPGLPLLMAAAKLIAGHDAMFWVVPLAGGILILSTFGIGCRLGSRRLGTIAAFLVATSGQFIANLFVTATEVPVAAAWTLACWGLLGRSLRSAVAAALAMTVAIVIRPNLVHLCVVIAIWVAVRVWREAPEWRREAWRAAIILAGCGAGALSTAAIYWRIYGSPLESGYGPASGYFAWSYVLPNLRTYAEQFISEQTPFAYLGLAALFVPRAWLWRGVSDRSAIVMMALFVFTLWAEFCFYLASAASLRFLLPAYPFIMIGLACAALAVARVRWRGAAALAAAGVLLLGLHTFNRARRSNVFRQWTEIVYADIGEAVGRATPPNSVVMAMQHSGSIRYYAGRVTLRWDSLPADWLDRGVAWLADRGVPTYVLVLDWELNLMKERFAGQHLASVLELPPVFSLGDSHLFDLSAPPDPSRDTEVIPLNPQRGRCPTPAPPPTLAWRPRRPH